MADFATPQLIVTNAGLNAANAANPYGPWVHITSFKIGSAYGYDPQKIVFDTDIDGDQLYKGVPTQYKNLGNGVLDIILRIPADAGPFEFGEVAIYNQDDQGNEHLFAKAVFEEPQIKYSSLGTNVASSFTLHALIKLSQSIAVFKIDTLINNVIMEVDRWSEIRLPYLSADPEAPLLLVRELDAAGCSSMLHYSVPGEEKWTIGTNYNFEFSTVVKNSSALSLTVPAADVNQGYYSSQDKQYVLEIADRNDPYRLTVKLVKSGNNAIFTIHPEPFADLPSPGTRVNVYSSQSFPPPLLATNEDYGVVKAGPGTIIHEPGKIQTHGLLHGVQDAGRILLSNINLDNTALHSGIYDIPGVGGQRPSNLPQGTYAGGQLFITNTIETGGPTQYVGQTFYPYTPDEDPIQAPYSAKDKRAYFRMYTNNKWSPWRTVHGTQATPGASGVWSKLPPGTPAPAKGIVIVTMSLGDGRGYGYANIYVNGTLHGTTRLNLHDSDHYGHVPISIPLNEGDIWTYSGTAGRAFVAYNEFFNWDA